MKRATQLLVMMITWCAAQAQIFPCSAPFFSEYIEGSGNNKAVELYNPASSTLNLNGYVIRICQDGSTSCDYHYLGGTLAAHDVFVIADENASAAILAQADLSTFVQLQLDGDDVIELRNGDITMDAIGQFGVDPGDHWAVGAGTTADHTLIRSVGVDIPDSDWGSASLGWTTQPMDYFDDLGGHTSDCAQTGLFQFSDLVRPRVHPVPADATVTIEQAAPAGPADLVEVLDLSGHVVMTEAIVAQPHVMDIRALPPALYGFRLLRAKEILLTGHFVVAR